MLTRLRAWSSALAGDEPQAPHQPVPHELWWLAGIVVLSLVVRFLGLRLGLPYFHHWDEVLVTSSARSMLERGDDLPSNYYYGAPVMRLTALAWKAATALRLPAPWTAPFADEVALRWVGRPVVATIAASGTVATYLAGRFALRRGVDALLAALAYATASELVWHARYLVTDASVVALTAWTLAFSAAYFGRRTLLLGAVAVLLAGLTFSFKLTGLATVLLPAGVLALRPARGLVREGDLPEPWLSVANRVLLVACVPAVVLVFLRLNPHVRDQWRVAFDQFEGIARHYREGHVKPFAERDAGLPHVLSALGFLATQSFSTSTLGSLAWFVPAVIGVGLAVRRGNVPVMLALVHAAGVVFAMAWPNRAYLTRMYLPAMPVLCLGFGLIAGSLSARMKAVPRRVLLAALSLALAGPALAQSIACHRGAVDPRVRAVSEIAARSGGRTVTVALSPGVVGRLALGGHPGVVRWLERPEVTFVRDAPTAEAAAASGADFVISATYRDLAKIWPYEEQWSFREVPGYVVVAEFGSNPYEERYDLQPTWDGHVTALVLERVGRPR
jgi:hypothetical protein